MLRKTRPQSSFYAGDWPTTPPPPPQNAGEDQQQKRRLGKSTSHKTLPFTWSPLPARGGGGLPLPTLLTPGGWWWAWGASHRPGCISQAAEAGRASGRAGEPARLFVCRVDRRSLWNTPHLPRHPRHAHTHVDTQRRRTTHARIASEVGEGGGRGGPAERAPQHGGARRGQARRGADIHRAAVGSPTGAGGVRRLGERGGYGRLFVRCCRPHAFVFFFWGRRFNSGVNRSPRRFRTESTVR